MLEAMDAFFEARLEGYDAHMLRDIEGAEEFYPFTASLLPDAPAAVLDLGCGTGLELEYYIRRCPEAQVTGIDLSAAMLAALRAKFPGRRLELLRGSYLELPLGTEAYDAAVSVESLHHFPAERKLELYRRLLEALKTGGFFVLTDYFAADDEEERLYFAELDRLRQSEGHPEDALLHYDTPLTEAHERALLLEAGFSPVEVLRRWGATSTLLARRPAAE